MNSLAQLTPKPQTQLMHQLRESIAEERAVEMARICRKTTADRFADLSDEDRFHWKAVALLALKQRTWADAELFARDYYSEQKHGHTFNRISTEQQLQVYADVNHIIQALFLYLSGMAEPMNEWRMQQTTVGAKGNT